MCLFLVTLNFKQVSIIMGQHIGTSWYTNQNITLDTQKSKRDEHKQCTKEMIKFQQIKINTHRKMTKQPENK